MSIFLLIRHANNPTIGKIIPGRRPGVHLNDEGRAQAEELVDRLGGTPIDAICSSPMERTRETAAPLAESLGLEIHTSEDFNEVEIGGWAGCRIEQLAKDPLWRFYNIFRTGTRPPGGELMIEVQQRMVNGIESLRRKHPQGIVAVFSHADPIKAALAHYAGIPLDFLLRLEISLTSVSIVSINDYGPKILCMNQLGRVPSFLLA